MIVQSLLTGEIESAMVGLGIVNVLRYDGGYRCLITSLSL